MPLIDASYFNGQIILPGVTSPDLLPAYNNAIAEYEEVYLRGLLGPSLYDAFMYGLDNANRTIFSDQFTSQFQQSPLDERWDWILNGNVFDYGTRELQWPGLRFTLGGVKKSPIANFIYSRYRRDFNTDYTQSGQSARVSENAVRVSAVPKMVEVWNRMVEWNRSLGYMLTGLSANYPEFSPRSTDPCLYDYQNEFGI